MTSTVVRLSPWRTDSSSTPPTSVQFTETTSIPTPDATPKVNLGFRTAAQSNLGYTQLTYVSASDGAQRRLPDCEYLIRSDMTQSGSAGGGPTAMTNGYTYMRNGRQVTISFQVDVGTLAGQFTGDVRLQFPSAAAPDVTGQLNGSYATTVLVEQAVVNKQPGVCVAYTQVESSALRLIFDLINTADGANGPTLDWSNLASNAFIRGTFSYLTAV